jgi:hypothetical protein
MNKDQLTTCKRCNGNACYEQNIDENTSTWLCMGCGFTTSTLMKEKGELVRNLIETSPELYKDLLFTDVDKMVWAPSTITLPNKGMVFLDGKNKDDWGWTAVQSIPITDEERKVKQFPKDQTHKMNMAELKSFKSDEFMDALEVIGFYDIQ